MRIFVSYHSPDQALAETLIADLTAARAALDFYFAPRNNTGGAYWLPRLEDELQAADALLLIVGDRIGEWQELEYFEALRLNRARGRPLIVPVIATKDAPGLPFLDQFHQLDLARGRATLIEAASAAFDGALDGALGGALGGAAAEAAEAPAWRATNPYRGLRPFESQNAAHFFGRDAMTSDLIEALAADDGRVLTLIGASGVGKSSLISAGLFSALRSRFHPGDLDRPWPDALAESHLWRTITVRPGERPLSAIAAGFARLGRADPAEIEAEATLSAQALAAGGGLGDLARAAAARLGAEGGAPARFLLNIDQGEELFSRADPGEGARAAEAIAEAAKTRAMAVVMSLRADFYGRLQGDPALFPAARRIDAPPLTEAEFADVITKPAARLGARLEAPGLVADIAAAAAGQPGGLPLLSVLMEEAWEAMRGDPEGAGVLRLPAGAVDLSRPLAARADAFLTAHPDLESAVQRLFTLRLAHMPKLGPAMRRRARRSECENDEWAAARALAAPEWRLLTLGEDGGLPTAEVAHEAVFAAWPRLAEWLDEEREFLIWRGHMQDARRAWEAAPQARRDDAALMGLSLAAARDWLERRGWALSDADRAFIRQSADLDDARRRKAAEREAALTAERERSRRRAAWIGRVAGIAAAAFLALSGWAIWERGRAEDERDRAEMARQSAEDEAARAEAAGARAEEAATRAAAERDLAVARDLARKADALLTGGPGQTATAAMIAADALTLRPTPEALAALRRALAFAPTPAEPADDRGADEVVFSADGARAAWIRRDWTGPADDKEIVETELLVLEGADLSTIWRDTIEGGASVRLAPGGETLVAAGATREALIADIGGESLRLPSRGDVAALMAEDGETIHLIHENGRIDIRTAPNWSSSGGLAFPAMGDAGRLTAALTAGRLVVGEIGFPGSAITEIPLAGGAARRVPFRTDPLAENHKQGRLRALAAGGGWAASVHDDDALRVWRIGAAEAPEERRIDGARFLSGAAVSPTGVVAAAGAKWRSGEKYDGIVALWDPEGEAVAGWVHQGIARSFAFSPDGAWLAVGGENGFSARALTGGEVMRGMTGDMVASLAFAPDGTLLVGAESGALVRYDPTTKARTAEARLAGPVRRLSVDPQSGRIGASVGPAEGTANWTDIRIADAKTGMEIHSFSWNGWLSNYAFSGDGSRFVAWDRARDETIVWRVANGRILSRTPREGILSGLDEAGDRLFFDDGRLTVRSAETGATLAELGEPGGVRRLYAIGPSGEVVVEGDDDSHGGWSLITGAPLWRTPPGDWTASQRRSGDGRLTVAYDEEAGLVRIVDAATEETRASFASPPIGPAGLTDDGARILAARPVESDDPFNSERHLLTFASLPEGEAIWTGEVDTRINRFPRIDALPGGLITAHGIGEIGDGDGDGGGVGRWRMFFHPAAETPWSPGANAAVQHSFKASDPAASSVLLLNTREDEWELRDARTGAVRWRRGRAGSVDSGDLALAAFLPDGARIALIETDRARSTATAIRILDAASGRELAAASLDLSVQAVAASVDGSRILLGVTADAKPALASLDAETLEEQVLIPVSNPIVDLGGLPDPDQVAVLDDASILEVRNLDETAPLHRIAMTVTTQDFALAARAPRAVTIEGASLRLWDIGTFGELAATVGAGEVEQVRISSDGETVAYVADLDGGGSHIGVWRPGATGVVATIPAEDVRAIGFSPDGDALFILSAELAPGSGSWRAATVRVVDIETLASRFTIRATGAGDIARVAFSGEGRSLLLEERGRYEGRGLTIRRSGLRAFDAETGRELARRPTIGEAVAAPDDGAFYHRGPDRRLKRFDPTATEIEPTLAPRGALRIAAESTTTLIHSYWGDNVATDPDSGRRKVLSSGDGPHVVIEAALSPDGRAAAFTLGDRRNDDGTGGLVVILDTASGDRIATLETETRYRDLRFAGPDRLALSELAGGATEEAAQNLAVWNWRRGTMKILIDDNPVVDIFASADGERIVSVEGALETIDDERRIVGAAQVRIWDAETGAELTRIPMDFAYPNIAFSPDWRRFAVMDQGDGFLYDVDADALTLTYGTDEARRDGVPHLASPIIPNKVNWLWPGFASEGRTLVIVTETEIIRRDLASGETKRFAESAPIKGAAFSRSGGVAALRTEGDVRIWDVEAGERLAAIPVAGLTGIGFAGPDAEHLIAVGEAGAKRLVWRRSELIDRACEAFAVDDWRLSRYWATGARDGGVCEAAAETTR